MIRPTAQLYRFGRAYNLLELFFRNRLADALEPVPFQPGDRVLDVGVGTGFTLKHYPKYVSVTGIDSAPEMLAVAQRKIDSGRVEADVQLKEADALALPFPDGTFDVVVLSHVITAVADPDRCLEEATRVARESGILVLVNHFRSQHPTLRRLERSLNPVCQWLGWKTNLSLGGLLYRAAATNDQMACQNGIVTAIHLQKWRGKLRVIHLPRPVANEPVPTHVLAGGLDLPTQSLPSPGAR